MKTKKEYPATHSMSTSWYIVDDEGNVGIMDYQDNGPVPWGIPEYSADDLKYGHEEDYNKNEFIHFDLTKEQILDLLHSPHKPSEENLWFDCAVKIREDKIERFLELCLKQDIITNHPLCISKEMCLYDFDACKCCKRDKDWNLISVIGTLKQILDENIIDEVYTVQKHSNMEDMPDECMDNSPYFLYLQPYDTNLLPEKIHTPQHPVREEQIPEIFRHRLHRIPGNFNNMESFQIAKYYTCEALGTGEYVVDGASYTSFPLPDGTAIYSLTNIIHDNFYPFCPEKRKYGCKSCGLFRCTHLDSIKHTSKPTVLILTDPRDDGFCTEEEKTNIIVQNSFVTPYLPKFPFMEESIGWVSQYEIKPFMTEDRLDSFLRGSKGYLEQLMTDINPYVVIITKLAYDIISKSFQIKDNTITIGSFVIPCYELAQLDSCYDEVATLAKMPYRGKQYRQTIPLDEMNTLIEQGIAKAFSTYYD